MAKLTKSQLLNVLAEKTGMSKNTKILIAISSVLCLVLIAIAVWVVFVAPNKQVTTRNSGLLSGGILGAELQPKSLKGEDQGRVNILILGTGDSDHPGATLSDSIIVASYKPVSGEVSLLSIPRDLYVQIPGYGWDKINAAHAYGEQSGEGGGVELAKKTVEQLLNQPINYTAVVNFDALVKVVDAVGGIDVYNKTDLYDSSYPCETINQIYKWLSYNQCKNQPYKGKRRGGKKRSSQSPI